MKQVSKLLPVIILLFLLVLMMNLKYDFSLTETGTAFLLICLVLILGSVLGEIASSLKLPKITGYTIAGLLFGINAKFIFHTDTLSLTSKDFFVHYEFIYGLVTGLIFFLLGGLIQLKELKEIKRSIISISSVNSLIFLIGIPLVNLILYHFIFSTSSLFDTTQVLLVSVFISLLLMDSAPEVIYGVFGGNIESSSFNKILLNSTLIKTLILLTLIPSTLIVSGNLGSLNLNLPSITGFEFLSKLILSVIIGLVFGLLFRFYLEYSKRELLILLIVFFLLCNEIASQLKLISPVLFLVIGFIAQNYSDKFEKAKTSIENYFALLFLMLFALTASKLDLSLISLFIFPVILIFVLRLFINFLSTKVVLSLLKFDKFFQNTFWLGYSSQGIFSLLLIGLIAQVLGKVGEIFSVVALSVVALNFIIGPPLIRIASKLVQLKEEGEMEKQSDQTDKIEFSEYKKFKAPNIEDAELSKLVSVLRDILIKYHNEYETFVNTQSEQAIEFYYQVVEKYLDEYQKLKNFIIDQKASGKSLKSEILKIQQELALWFANLSSTRIKLEESFFEAESLLQSLFDELEIYSDNSPKFLVVKQEEDKYQYLETDRSFVKAVKFFKRFDLKLRNFLGIKLRLRRKIPYSTLVKYYFEYKISQEMKDVAFIIGMERLNILRKIKTIFDDVNKNLEELLNLVSAHKEIQAISTIAIDKLNEIHEKLKQEITSIQEEVNTSTINTCTRLQYAFANPFNEFLSTLNKAGTIEINLRNFQFSKLYDKTENTKESTRETLRYWKNYLQGFLGICQRDAKTIQIMGKIKDLIDETIIYIFDATNQELKTKNQELSKSIKKIDKEISKGIYSNLENISELISLIKKSRDEFLELIKIKGNIHFLESKRDQSTTKIVSLLKDHFKKVLQEFQDFNDVKVLSEKELEKIDIQTQYIPLKTLPYLTILQNYFENKIIPEMVELHRLIASQFNSSLNESQALENIIKFHFNVALTELEEIKKSEKIVDKSSEISRIITEHLKNPLKLLLEKIKVLNKQMENFQVEFELTLTKKLDEQIDNLKNIFKEKTAEVIEKGKTPSQLAAFISLLEKIKVLIRKTCENISDLFLSVRKVAKSYIKEIEEISGKEWEGKSVILYSYHQTQYDYDIYNSLPQIYRGLFSSSASDFAEILVGRKNEIEILIEAYQRSQKELPTSCAIIGENGTGKSSLISAFLPEQTGGNAYISYTFKQTIYSENALLNELKRLFKFDYLQTYQDLISELLTNPPAPIIIFEDIHKTFLRTKDGLEAIKKLLLIISETNHKIFWIVSISYHAWQLLNKIILIDNYFTYQIKTECLRKEELHEAIMKRQKASSYDVEFLIGDDSQLKKKIKYSFSPQEAQKILEKEYFDKLFEVTEGNITSALFYWIKSIKEFKNNTIYINQINKLDFSFIPTLHISKILTLSNLILHGSLTIKEHSKIFRITEDESRTIFNFLSSANLVNSTINEHGEKVYSINQAIYKPLEIELRKLHIFE